MYYEDDELCDCKLIMCICNCCLLNFSLSWLKIKSMFNFSENDGMLIDGENYF